MTTHTHNTYSKFIISEDKRKRVSLTSDAGMSGPCYNLPNASVSQKKDTLGAVEHG